MKSPLIAIPMDYLDVSHEPEAAWYSKYTLNHLKKLDC